MSALLPLVVTRADPGGAATAARAAAMGLDVRHLPLFEARALDWSIPDPADFDALLITSAQAARLAGPGLSRLASLPVYAVGRASADAAAAAGLAIARVGGTDAQSLVDAMTSSNIGRILWLCGRDRSALDPRGADLVARACYAVDPVPPPAGWAEAVAGPAVLLVHSGRGARRLADLVPTGRERLSLVAISAAVARAAGAGWDRIVLAERPDDAAMLAQAHALCHKGRKMGSVER